ADRGRLRCVVQQFLPLPRVLGLPGLVHARAATEPLAARRGPEGYAALGAGDPLVRGSWGCACTGPGAVPPPRPGRFAILRARPEHRPTPVTLSGLRAPVGGYGCTP